MSDTIRPGNSYTEEPLLTLTNANGSAFELANSTVRLTATTATGTQIVDHFITFNALGNVTASSNMTVVGTSASGIVSNNLTAIETLSMTGWMYWTASVTDILGNTEPVAAGTWKVSSNLRAGLPGSITRRDLRRMILGEVGGIRILKATANGSDVTFIDATNLIGENNTYIDQQAYFAGGTVQNLELIRHVTGSNRDQRAIGFGLALPMPTAIGDVVELVNMRGTGYQIADVHQALDEAMISARTGSLIPATQTMGTYSRTTGSLEIPPDWVLISGIQWQDEAGAWRPMRIASRAGGDGWSVDKYNRLVEVGGTWGYKIDGATVRLAGMTAPERLEHDDDTTGVNAEWLTAQAVANLLQGSYLRHPTQERRDIVFQAQQKANGLRALAVNRIPANAIKL